ncbi:MAG TPA: hypothetical protein VEF04_02860 [Blastocatellia bacterium]|nr:hypothetical protein [Blastocatellia bacterium]
MAGKSKLKKKLDRLEKRVGQLLAAPFVSKLFDRESLTPVDKRQLEILLLSIGFQNFNLKNMLESERRALFAQANHCRFLREQWAQQVSVRFPKQSTKDDDRLRRLEREVSNVVVSIRRSLGQTK